MGVMHFKTQKERLDYLKGKFEEITPQEAEPVVEEKPKKAKKTSKKSKKEDK